MTADTWAGRCNGCGHEIARVGCQCPVGGAEVLRRAAALMRERAEAATGEHRVHQTLLRGVVRCSCGASSVGQPDWGRKHLADLTWQVSRDDATQVWDERERLVSSAEGLGEAAHIASWHPAVALAVADLLEQIAGRYECWEYAEEEFQLLPAYIAQGITLARAYLGESS